MTKCTKLQIKTSYKFMLSSSHACFNLIWLIHIGILLGCSRRPSCDRSRSSGEQSRAQITMSPQFAKPETKASVKNQIIGEKASTEIPLLWPWLKAFRTLADWIISLGSLAFLQFSPSAQCLVVSLKSGYSDPFKWYVCFMIGAKWGVHQSRPWKIKGFVQIVATHPPHPPYYPPSLWCCANSIK